MHANAEHQVGAWLRRQYLQSMEKLTEAASFLNHTAQALSGTGVA